MHQNCVIMPGVTGKELAERIQEVRPGTPVIYMSGYADSIITRRGMLEGETIVQKPFSSAVLLAGIERMIDSVSVTVGAVPP